MAWAERSGLTVDVATNRDLEDHPDLLDRYRLVASVGHDEYWSWGMRDTMDAWVAAGGNWLILSGNTSFWQVRYGDETIQAEIADGLQKQFVDGSWDALGQLLAVKDEIAATADRLPYLKY